MKLIFLDIDGVLNSEKWYRQRKYGSDKQLREYGADKQLWDERHEFDPESVSLFNQIIFGTDAKIVVSSSWRRQNLSYLQTLFQMVGIQGEVIGETPKLWGENFGSVPRGCEIKSYLNDLNYPLYEWDLNPTTTEVETYCIIDDDSDMLYEQRNNFVHTSNMIGLTHLDIRQAIKILNGVCDET